MSFKLLDQLENLTPVWKFVEAELPSEPCLNKSGKTSFRNMSLHKRSSAPSTKASLDYFCLIYRTVNYFPMTIWKEKNE